MISPNFSQNFTKLFSKFHQVFFKVFYQNVLKISPNFHQFSSHLFQDFIKLFNLFYHELGNGYFIIERFSKKSSIFGENCEEPICGREWPFWGEGPPATKINITLFVGIHVLNIFYLTTFSKKNNISRNISEI